MGVAALLVPPIFQDAESSTPDLANPIPRGRKGLGGVLGSGGNGRRGVSGMWVGNICGCVLAVFTIVPN